VDSSILETRGFSSIAKKVWEMAQEIFTHYLIKKHNFSCFPVSKMRNKQHAGSLCVTQIRSTCRKGANILNLSRPSGISKIEQTRMTFQQQPIASCSGISYAQLLRQMNKRRKKKKSYTELLEGEF
jgi:hypothetical protein